MALIIVIAIAPVQGWLRRRGLPGWATTLVLILCVYGVLILLALGIVVYDRPPGHPAASVFSRPRLTAPTTGSCSFEKISICMPLTPGVISPAVPMKSPRRSRTGEALPTSTPTRTASPFLTQRHRL